MQKSYGHDAYYLIALNNLRDRAGIEGEISVISPQVETRQQERQQRPICPIFPLDGRGCYFYPV